LIVWTTNWPVCTIFLPIKLKLMAILPNVIAYDIEISIKIAHLKSRPFCELKEKTVQKKSYVNRAAAAATIDGIPN